MTKKLTTILLISVCALFLINKTNAQCWQLVWSDEFDGTTLNTDIWTYEVNGDGGGNNELQYYTSDTDNLWLEDGILTIKAIKENYLDKAYTSARINTNKKYMFQYGKIEARMKLPYGQGIWPACWMLGESLGTAGWPACGEIDIMEMIGGTAAGKSDKTVYSTLHWFDVEHKQYGTSYTLPSGRFADAYHTFSVEWNATTLKTYCDGIQYYVINLSPEVLSEFRQKFFIILNLAVGGNWPGAPDATTVFPQTLQVDYIRVYSSNPDLIEIQGKKEVTKGQSDLVYHILYTAGTKYHWFLPDGITAKSSVDSSAITLDWGCKADTLLCAVKTACDSIVVSYPVALKDYEISGDTYFVPATATDYTFSVPAMAGATYNWTVPGDVTLNSGQGTNSINVTWGTNPGTVSLNLVNSCDDTTLVRPMLTAGVYPYPNPVNPHEIPGSIESVDFDYGGEGISYHDNEAANQGSSYRTDQGVDIEANDGGYNVGWTMAGEWLKYTVKVNTPGEYYVELRNASNTGGGKIDISFNNEVKINDYTFSNTGGWGSFVSSYLGYITLDAEDTVMKYDILVQDVNLGRIIFWEKDLIAPTDPTTLNGTVTKNSISLTWTGSTDNQKMLGYKVYVDGVYKATTAANATNYSITGLSNNTLYNVAIVASDIQGNTSDSLKGSFTTLIDNINVVKSNKIELFPNPASDKVYLKGNTTAGTNISILNLLGQVVDRVTVEQNATDYLLNISELKSGIYIINISNKSANSSYRIYKK
jgi:beta-glucanase (GH16 family)